jgi:hypothetical protein
MCVFSNKATTSTYNEFHALFHFCLLPLEKIGAFCRDPQLKGVVGQHQMQGGNVPPGELIDLGRIDLRQGNAQDLKCSEGGV